MLNKLKSLIFGLDEYDKTKIEVRFQLIDEMLEKYDINDISDFEIIEECIYKIKDQLRVKSSNLNKVINDPSRNLRKKDVIESLEKLSKVKYGFLEKAFSAINKEETSLKSDVDEIENLKEEKSEDYIKQEENISELSEIVENEKYLITLENGKVPYMKIKFKDEVDYAFLRDMASFLFETYKAHRTNILVEKNTALIIPRFMEDNLFTLPKMEMDIEEVYAKIISNLNEKGSKKDEYINVEKKEEIVDKKKEDSSLDQLLEGLEKEKKPEFKPKKKEDEDKFKILKDEPVTIEKKEVREPEVEILSEKSDGSPFEVYRDDKIVAHLKTNSKVFGELIIEDVNGRSLRQLNESDISYITIFSKIFSSALFEVLQAHGTNILWDYNSSQLRIVPRFTEDNSNLNLKGKESSADFLEQVKNKLLAEMGKGTQTNENVEEEKKNEVEKKSTGSDKKAKYIIDQLRRIP